MFSAVLPVRTPKQFKAVRPVMAAAARSPLIDVWLRRFQAYFSNETDGPDQITVMDTVSREVLLRQRIRLPTDGGGQFSRDSKSFIVEDEGVDTVYLWDIPPRKSLTWFAVGAALLAVPIALVASRRVRRLRAA